MAKVKTNRKPATQKIANKTVKKTTVTFQDETKVHPVLREYFGYCLFKAGARLRMLMDKALESKNLQTHHLGILKLLKVIGPTSQIDLGDALGFDKASMVKLIDHLEALKFVTRRTDPKDRRVKNVEITAKGSAETDVCIMRKGNVEKEFFGNVTNEEREFLRRVIPKLLP
jgi:DNA-binding MarR family transcriptional regulator